MKKTKAQVEADLKRKSASINQRMEKIESSLPVPPKQLRRLLSRKTLIRLGIAASIGLAAGIVAMRSRRDASSSYRDEVDAVSSAIGKEIKKNINRGIETDAAVKKALGKRPPIVHVGSDGTSFLGGMLSTLSRHIASAVGPVIAEKIADRLRGRADEK